MLPCNTHHFPLDCPYWSLLSLRKHHSLSARDSIENISHLRSSDSECRIIHYQMYTQGHTLQWEREREGEQARFVPAVIVSCSTGGGGGSALSARGTWHRQGQWKLPAHAICVKQFVVHVLVVTAGATWFNLSRLPRAAHVKTTRYNCNNNNSNNRNVWGMLREREREGRG